MRLPRNCKKGNALYNLSMNWNTAKDSHKLAGNMFALKQSLKEEIEIKTWNNQKEDRWKRR